MSTTHGLATDLDRLFHELDTESDRAAAVLGAALLDVIVKSLILNGVADIGVADKLLRKTGPLGSFSARIDVARAFGLLTADEAHDLHIVRRIRNEFAHDLRQLDFNTQQIVDLAGNLRLAPTTVATTAGGHTTRARFAWAVARLSYTITGSKLEHIWMQIAQVKHQMEQNQNRIADLDIEIAQRDKRIAEFQKRIADLENESAQKEKQVAQTDKRTAEVENEKARIRNRIAQIDKEIAEKENLIAGLSEIAGKSAR